MKNELGASFDVVSQGNLQTGDWIEAGELSTDELLQKGLKQVDDRLCKTLRPHPANFSFDRQISNHSRYRRIRSYPSLNSKPGLRSHRRRRNGSLGRRIWMAFAPVPIQEH